jgi:hypothetical protein
MNKRMSKGAAARKHIDGGDAARMAVESSERDPVQIEPLPADEGAASAATTGATALIPASSGSITSQPTAGRKRPPRVRKPIARNDQCFAPTADLEGHRAALRQAFGNTLSDEFVSVLLSKLISALRPGSHDKLEEATLNAAIAMLSSMDLQSEQQAMLGVQIVSAGFSGLRFLGMSQRHMDEIYIGVYGGYAIKLLRLQLDMIQTLDRHRRGSSQTVEVRHVHIHSGAQGVVGIVNSQKTPEGDEEK